MCLELVQKLWWVIPGNKCDLMSVLWWYIRYYKAVLWRNKRIPHTCVFPCSQARTLCWPDHNNQPGFSWFCGSKHFTHIRSGSFIIYHLLSPSDPHILRKKYESVGILTNKNQAQLNRGHADMENFLTLSWAVFADKWNFWKEKSLNFHEIIRIIVKNYHLKAINMWNIECLKG